MVELRFGLHTVDLPYLVRIPDVSEAQFDEWVDEETKAELLDGVMIVHSPASPRHDNVAGFLRSLMRFYAESKELGLVLGPDSLIRLASGRRVGPDIFFLSRMRAPRRLPKKNFQIVPDLVVEVLSPSNRMVDVEEKRPLYHQAGLPELWLVDPDEQTIQVDLRQKRSYASRVFAEQKVLSSVLPGFWIDPNWLWAEPLPNLADCYKQILG